jgi:hypothetical protein
MSPEIFSLVALIAPVVLFGFAALAMALRPEADLEGLLGGAGLLVAFYFVIYITGLGTGG